MNRSSFTDGFFANPVKPCRTNTNPVGLLGSINRVICGPKLFHLMSAWFVVCSVLLWPSVWPTVHTTWSAVSTGIVDLPTHPTLICSTPDIAGCVQIISQNQQVHQVASYILC